jgi:hypothetical protein
MTAQMYADSLAGHEDLACDWVEHSAPHARNFDLCVDRLMGHAIHVPETIRVEAVRLAVASWGYLGTDGE